MSRRNRTLETLNPLRGLTPATAIARLEAGQRGELPLLMWTYHLIEQTDPDLLALVERRTGALLNMDWDIRVQPKADATLAAEQQAVLRAAYERIGNIYEAIEHLAMATFRGFSIAQLVAGEGEAAAAADPGMATRIDCLDHWNWCRDGIASRWRWNPEARQTSFDALPAEGTVVPGAAGFLVREVRRPVDRVALVKYLRGNFTQKAWMEFLEIAAEQGLAAVAPAGLPEDKVQQFRSDVESFRDGGAGVFPNGTTINWANPQRGLIGFEEHMRFLREQLVLAGTGGMLSMLAMPQGIGGGASGEHADAFRQLAVAEAQRISELFQRAVDAQILRRNFPGRPVLAWFEIAAREERDVGKVIDQVTRLAAAGFVVPPEIVEEQTGYKVSYTTPAAPVQTPGSGGFALNSARGAEPAPELQAANDKLLQQAVAETLRIRAELVGPWFKSLEEKAASGALSDAELLDALERMAEELPELFAGRGVEETAKVIEGLLGASVANALAAREAAR